MGLNSFQPHASRSEYMIHQLGPNKERHEHRDAEAACRYSAMFAYS